MKSSFFILICFLPSLLHAAVAPDPLQTPGFICQTTDADFKGYDYPEHVARCNRNIAQAEKLQVAQNYGNIPQANWSQYEFDHMIPLCAGGANDIKNLWPQPIAEARQKDVLENNICLAMKAGTLMQADAIQKVRDWFQTNAKSRTLAERNIFEIAKANLTRFICNTNDSTTIRFSLQNATTISDGSVTLATEAGEHEVIRSKESVTGRPVAVVSELLKGYLRFVLNKRSDDHFELFLPAQFSAVQTFRGYFKVSFEGNYPNLTELTCKTITTDF